MVHEKRLKKDYHQKLTNVQNGKILHVSKSMFKWPIQWYIDIVYSVECTLQFHTCDTCHVRISYYYYKNPTFPGPCLSICTVPTCGKILPCISHGSQGSLARNTVDCLSGFSHHQIVIYLTDWAIGYEQYTASHETSTSIYISPYAYIWPCLTQILLILF